MHPLFTAKHDIPQTSFESKNGLRESVPSKHKTSFLSTASCHGVRVHLEGKGSQFQGQILPQREDFLHRGIIGHCPLRGKILPQKVSRVGDSVGGSAS